MSARVKDIIAMVLATVLSSLASGVLEAKPDIPVKIEVRCGCADELAPPRQDRQEEPDPAVEPTSSELADPTIPDVAAVHPFRCEDDQGREGAFKAMVFLDVYNWSYKSIDLVEFNHQPIDFLEVLKQPAVRQVLDEAKQVVAVGTASCEASKYFWGHLAEERRAGRRARQLAGWIASLSPRHVHELNVGRFQKSCDAQSPEETWNQRRIVLISVTEQAKDLDMKSCLLQSMKNDQQLDFLVENYSQFEIDQDWER